MYVPTFLTESLGLNMVLLKFNVDIEYLFSCYLDWKMINSFFLILCFSTVYKNRWVKRDIELSVICIYYVIFADICLLQIAAIRMV